MSFSIYHKSNSSTWLDCCHCPAAPCRRHSRCPRQPLPLPLPQPQPEWQLNWLFIEQFDAAFRTWCSFPGPLRSRCCIETSPRTANPSAGSAPGRCPASGRPGSRRPGLQSRQISASLRLAGRYWFCLCCSRCCWCWSGRWSWCCRCYRCRHRNCSHRSRIETVFRPIIGHESTQKSHEEIKVSENAKEQIFADHSSRIIWVNFDKILPLDVKKTKFIWQQVFRSQSSSLCFGSKCLDEIFSPRFLSSFFSLLEPNPTQAHALPDSDLSMSSKPHKVSLRDVTPIFAMAAVGALRMPIRLFNWNWLPS